MNKNIKNTAFSLIEISIIILIITVLIIGISKGLDLFRSSKLSSAQNLTKNSPVTAIDNLVLWLEPTLVGSLKNQNGSEDIDDGDKVSAWTDINPTNSSTISIEQNNPSFQPQYVRKGVNNLPSVRFNYLNDNQRLMKPGIMTGRKIETTYFVVLKWSSSHSINGQILGFGGNNSSGQKIEHYLYIMPGDQTPANAVGTSFWAASYNDGGYQAAANSVKKGESRLFTVYYDPKANVSRLYSAKQILGTGGATVSDTFYSGAANDIVIGNHETAPRTIGADIAEIIIYDRALADEEIDSIQTYLMKKYNIN